MKALKLAALFLCVLGVAGCDDEEDRLLFERDTELDTNLARAHRDEGIRNAILAQHTIYGYHFTANSASLNALGVNDVGVLAEHYRDYPGAISVRRGDADEAMYKARVASVAEALRSGGVQKEIVIGDALPGGEGMSSERVLRILTEENKRRTQSTATYSTSTVTTNDQNPLSDRTEK